jgi:DNA-binding transcriptional ArsR family regulator
VDDALPKNVVHPPAGAAELRALVEPLHPAVVGMRPQLITGEKPVGAIVDDLSMSQPQVSKHLRVLSEVGLVRARADGRRRLYRLEPARSNLSSTY